METPTFDAGPYEHSAHRIFTRLMSYEHVKADPKMQNRTGIRVEVWKDGAMAQFLVGALEPEREAACKAFAGEKIDRLMLHAEHWSSSQSKDPAHDQYNGAVKTEAGYIGVSGLPEDYDEVVALAIAVDQGDLTAERAEWIAQRLSNNSQHLSLTDLLVGL